MQIDAAINPGNSGGPAFANLASSEVVGVAFSRHKQAEATGYIIPYIVVQHFMESFRRRGLFSGLCCLGMLVNRLENPSLRRYHKVPLHHHQPEYCSSTTLCIQNAPTVALVP